MGRNTVGRGREGRDSGLVSAEFVPAPALPQAGDGPNRWRRATGPSARGCLPVGSGVMEDGVELAEAEGLAVDQFHVGVKALGHAVVAGEASRQGDSVP